VNSLLTLCVAAACALATWSCESAPRAHESLAPVEFTIIRGVVVDTSGRPVVDADIVGPNSRITRTDEQGRFEFRWFRRPIEFVAQHVCYQPSSRRVGEPDGEELRLVLSPKITIRLNFANAPRAAEVEPLVFVQGVSREFRTISAQTTNKIVVVEGLRTGLNIIRVVLAEKSQLVAYDALFEFEDDKVVDLDFAPSPRSPATLQTTLPRDEKALLRGFYPTLPNLSWVATHTEPTPAGAKSDELSRRMQLLAPKLADELFDIGYPSRIGGFLAPPAPGSYLLLTAQDAPNMGDGYIDLHVERVEAVSQPD